MAMEQLEQTRLRVIGDVKRAYFQLYALDNTISITEENLVLLRDLIEVTRGQLVAGRGQQEDVLRSQVELSNLESKLVELRQRRITTASLLNALLDRPHTMRVPTPPEYDVRLPAETPGPRKTRSPRSGGAGRRANGDGAA